jgi:alkaline phosphatase D
MKTNLFIILFAFFIVSCGEINNKPEPTYNNHVLPSDNKVLQKIAFSSGCKQNLFQQFWENISEKEPDLWIWGGDNIYSDTKDRNILKRNYDILKTNRYYQDFIKLIPVVGIWDDHDYGARDSGEGYELKEESKEEFVSFFDIPQSSEIRTHEGIFTTYELGVDNKKIKFYLLDNRTFKTELTLDTQHENWYLPDSTGTVLGEQQWQWLENEINRSEALINIFVSGIQIIPNDHIFEKWGNFPNERLRFLHLLENTKVKNPIILSGDRHFAEFSEVVFDDDSKVTEFTASGMTHSYEGVDEINVYRIAELYDGKNFGILEIDWKEDNTAKLDMVFNIINYHI